ncbi:MAG TPA: YdcF family protein [Candidatus Limnocylindrales bacterium]|nr:YdcF family protein [Candidatus Limnocylindrales bacterium]
MRRHLVRLLLAALVTGVAAIGWATFRIWETGNRDDRQTADAIVVLGAAQYDGRPSPVFRARLDHAVDLYEAGVARFLVVTGGKAQGDRTTEAAAARAFAIARGVPASAILVEDRGRTTLESLHAVAALLQAHDLSSAVFVSDRTHMLRVLRIARDQGITAYGSPTSTSPTDATFLTRADATIHELGALTIYFVTGQTP